MTSKRRTPRPAAAGLVAVGILALLATACQWAGPRYGPGRTGYNPSERTITAANVSQLAPRWHQDLGSSGFSGLLAADGLVYVADGSNPGSIDAFDATTGAGRWSSPAGNWLSALSGGALFVSAWYGSSNTLSSLDAATGAVRWSVPTDGPVFGHAVVDGSSLIGAFDSDAGEVVRAYDTETGALRWSSTANVWQPPSAANGVVYLLADRTTGGLVPGLYALDSQTGRPRWHVDGAFTQTPAVVTGGVVYVEQPDRLVTIDAADGHVRWARSYATDLGPLAVTDAQIFAKTGGSTLSSLDLGDGHELWRVHGTGWSPTVAGGVVYLASFDHAAAWDAGSGAPLWTTSYPTESTTDDLERELVVVDGTAYVMPDTAHLLAFRARSSTPFLTMSPTFEHDFGRVLDGAESSAVDRTTYTITNTSTVGSGPIEPAFAGADGAQFRITSNDCPSSGLAPGASCGITTGFAPTRPGRLAAQLVVSLSGGSPVVAPVSGYGFPFEFDDKYPDLGEYRYGTTSPERTLTVTNRASTAAGPIVEQLSGQPVFHVTGDTCLGATLPPDGTCRIRVTFTPTDPLPLTGVLSVGVGRVTPSYRGDLGTSALSGRADSWFTLSGPTAFGSVPVGQTKRATFTVTNTGPATAGPMHESLTLVGWFPFGSIVGDTCAGSSLAPHGSCTIVVEFAPALPTTLTATLTAAGLGGGAVSRNVTGLGT